MASPRVVKPALPASGARADTRPISTYTKCVCTNARTSSVYYWRKARRLRKQPLEACGKHICVPGRCLRAHASEGRLSYLHKPAQTEGCDHELPQTCGCLSSSFGQQNSRRLNILTYLQTANVIEKEEKLGIALIPCQTHRCYGDQV